MEPTIGKIRPTIYFCEICKKEFRAKRGGRGDESAKAHAIECSLLPTTPYMFSVRARVSNRVLQTRRKRLGKRPKYSPYTRLPIYVVVERKRERRGTRHVNVYLVEKEGRPNDTKIFFDERSLALLEK